MWEEVADAHHKEVRRDPSGKLPRCGAEIHEVSIRRLVPPTPLALLHSGTAPVCFHMTEALFLPGEALELHVRAKRLHHQWDLSRESLGAHVPQALVSAP